MADTQSLARRIAEEIAARYEVGLIRGGKFDALSDIPTMLEQIIATQLAEHDRKVRELLITAILSKWEPPK